MRGTAAAALSALLAAAAAAQGVALAGRMGGRALLVVDGRPYTAGVGDAVAGVRLLGWSGDDAEIERGGTRYLLRAGAAPAQLRALPAPAGGREIALTAGPGGHFTTTGSINGRPVRFMIDTGATLVALGSDDALRLGIDLTSARAAISQTANGLLPVRQVTLASVRVGDIELFDVAAAVMPQPMPVVLLGNSFLSRLQMRRDNDVMRLELR